MTFLNYNATNWTVPMWLDRAPCDLRLWILLEMTTSTYVVCKFFFEKIESNIGNNPNANVVPFVQ